MISLELYDMLDGMIDGLETDFMEYKQQFEVTQNEEGKLSINSVKSLARQTIVSYEDEEQPLYSDLYYKKNGYVSYKLTNWNFSLESFLNILCNAQGVIKGEIFSCLMIAFTVIKELMKIEVKLDPEMSVIVGYLFENQYTRKKNMQVSEQQLKESIKQLLQHYGLQGDFEDAINGLYSLKVIQIDNGMIQLIETVKS